MQEMLSTIANWCSIASVPALIAAYWQIYRTRKEVAATQERGSWGDMVKFVNVRDEVGIAVAPFKGMAFLPRVGERLTLPETPDGLKCGDYRVLNIHHICFANDDNDGDASLMNVRVEVEPIQSVVHFKRV